MCFQVAPSDSEREPRGGMSARLESEVRAREPSARVPPLRGELKICLPVDYEILGKCIYVRKSTDGVRNDPTGRLIT